jgi:hypothetical protein
MTADWIPFGKPVRYCRPRTAYHEPSGWLIAWRPAYSMPRDAFQESDLVAIEYLTLDCSIILVNEGDKLEIIP